MNRQFVAVWVLITGLWCGCEEDEALLAADVVEDAGDAWGTGKVKDTSGGMAAETISTTDSIDPVDTIAPVDAGPLDPVGPVPGDVPPTVTFSGRKVLVDGDELELRGVNWNPVGIGGYNQFGLDWTGFVVQDAPLMAAAGINAVRTFHPIDDTSVLDTLQEHGIWVLMTVYIGGNDPVESVDARVNAVKDHPAVLLWQVGNEWNYNNLYTDMSFEAARDRVEAVAARVQTLDDRPVATVYGEVPSAELVAAIPSADIWGLNAYRYDGFYGLFENWAAVSDKPMYVAEYGVDAWNSNLPAYDPTSHATGTELLTTELMDNHTSEGGVAFGGCVFEWADEWWKDESGSPSVQDSGGVAPGGGPYPDATFNEEWWGIVDINRVTRPAYDRLKALYTAPAQ